MPPFFVNDARTHSKHISFNCPIEHPLYQSPQKQFVTRGFASEVVLGGTCKTITKITLGGEKLTKQNNLNLNLNLIEK